MHTEYYFQDITMTLKKNLSCFRNSQMTKEVVLIFFSKRRIILIKRARSWSYLIQWENCNSLISLARTALLSIHKGKSGRHSSAWLTTSVIVFFNYNKVNSSITSLAIYLSSLLSLRIAMLEQNRAGFSLICRPSRRSAPTAEYNQHSEEDEESRHPTKTCIRGSWWWLVFLLPIGLSSLPLQPPLALKLICSVSSESVNSASHTVNQSLSHSISFSTVK